MMASVYCYFLEEHDISTLERSGAFALLGEGALQWAEEMSSKRKREYLLSRILLRFVLSLHLPDKVGGDIQIQERNGGPPVVALAEEHGIGFNISHSHALIGVAVSLSGAVGLDIEYLLKQRPYQLGAKSFCNSSEYDRVISARSERQMAQLYYQYWTQKEAMVKYTREGIGKTPMREIIFESVDDSVKSSQRPMVIGGGFGQYQIAVVSEPLGELTCFNVNISPDGLLRQHLIVEGLSGAYVGVLKSVLSD